MSRSPIGVVAAVVLLSLALTPALRAELSLAIEKDRIVARDVPPKAEVVFFAIAREASPTSSWTVRIVPYEAILLDEDGDGEVVYILDGEVPWKSVWAATDLAKGGLAIAVPDDFPLKEVEFDLDEAMELDLDDDLSLLSQEGQSSEMLLARPGIRAWRLSISDGGPDDTDQTDDGWLLASLKGARPIGTTKGDLAEILPGDVLVGIDPKSLEFWAVQVAIDDKEGKR